MCFTFKIILYLKLRPYDDESIFVYFHWISLFVCLLACLLDIVTTIDGSLFLLRALETSTLSLSVDLCVVM